MGRFLSKLWHETKSRGEDIGIPFLILGFLVVMVKLGLILANASPENIVLPLGLALVSVGLGFTSVGMSAKSDKRQTDLLERLDKNVSGLPLLFKGDILAPSGQIAVRELHEEQSEEAAQKRLDEDTRRVGYVRGEVFQHEDGTWSIHWGGKYRL